MNCQRRMSSALATPFPLSATASTRSSGPVSSSGSSGYRIRAQTVAGPGSVKCPCTGRHSMADRYPSTQPSLGGGGGVSVGSGGGGSGWGGTGGLSVRSTRQAVARATSRPPPLATASSSSTLRPGRVRRACTRISPTGIGRRMSQVKRAMIMSSRGSQRWIARPRRALGGPPCWARASHGPVVWRVASHVSSPAGR